MADMLTMFVVPRTAEARHCTLTSNGHLGVFKLAPKESFCYRDSHINPNLLVLNTLSPLDPNARRSLSKGILYISGGCGVWRLWHRGGAGDDLSVGT